MSHHLFVKPWNCALSWQHSRRCIPSFYGYMHPGAIIHIHILHDNVWTCLIKGDEWRYYTRELWNSGIILSTQRPPPSPPHPPRVSFHPSTTHSILRERKREDEWTGWNGWMGQCHPLRKQGFDLFYTYTYTVFIYEGSGEHSALNMIIFRRMGERERCEC